MALLCQQSDSGEVVPGAIKLPNGCWLRPGGRVRIPREHLERVPVGTLGIYVERGTQSFGSVVVARESA